MKEKILCYFLLVITVPIAGEFKFYPFDDDFRISLGTPLFLFYLLWLNKINPIVSGMFVGMSVVLFRITIADSLFFSSSSDELVYLHLPVFFYYFIYGLIFYLFRINNFYNYPLIIGLLCTIAEIGASYSELLARYLLLNHSISALTLTIIVPIAFIRSFFVLGFFHALILEKIKQLNEIQQKKNEQMLILISNLYVEMIQLNKSMKDAEELTRNCYDLYRKLTKENNPASKEILKIAGEIHEIKKDHQRIHFGLQKLMVKEKLVDVMGIEEIIEIVCKTNQNYSEGCNKKITFQHTIQGTHHLYPSYLLLSILNNLVSNAVEAIKYEGIISIHVLQINKQLSIQVIDNGTGIAPKHIPLIFQPGFTTKFDQEGKASNGIGLPYIKKVIEDLHGTIQLHTSDLHDFTTFEITLPIVSLVKSEVSS